MLCNKDLPNESLDPANNDLRFDAFMGNAPAVAFIKDGDGRIVYVNRLFEEFWHTSLRDCRGKNDEELWPPEVARQFREHDLQVLLTRERIEVVESVPMPDGRQRKFLVTKFPFADLEGTILVGGSESISHPTRRWKRNSANK